MRALSSLTGPVCPPQHQSVLRPSPPSLINQDTTHPHAQSLPLNSHHQSKANAPPAVSIGRRRVGTLICRLRARPGLPRGGGFSAAIRVQPSKGGGRHDVPVRVTLVLTWLTCFPRVWQTGGGDGVEDLGSGGSLGRRSRWVTWLAYLPAAFCGKLFWGLDGLGVLESR